MKLSTIIFSSIIALVPSIALAQSNWVRYPEWVRQRSNPHQFVQIGSSPAFYHLVDKKLIPLGGDKYGFIFRNQTKKRSTNPAPEYSEVYSVLNCRTGDYDVIGKLYGDNRGNIRWYPQCTGSGCLSPYPDEPEPKYVAIIKQKFCPRR
jgi:hypothetical protein